MTKPSKDEFDHTLKLIVKTSLFVFFGLLLSKIFTYLYRIIIARYYGPEIYGVFSLSLMVLGFFASFASLGFSEGVLKFLSQYKGKKDFSKIKSLIFFTLILSLISSVLFGILLYLSSEFISINFFNTPELTVFLKISAFGIPLWVLSSLILGIIKSFEHVYFYSFITNIVSTSSRILTLGFFIFLGLNSSFVAFSYILGFFFMLFFSFTFFQKKIIRHLKKERGDPSSNLDLLSYSWPIILLGVVTSLFSWIDSFSIGFFIDAKNVGFYNAAIPVASLLTLAPDIFMQLFFPLANRNFHANNQSLVRNVSKRVLKWIFLVNLPLLFALLVFPGVILNLLFGGEYLVSENAVRFLAAGFFLYSIFFLSSRLVLISGKSRFLLYNLLAISLLNFALNFLLVPRLGITGAAISTSLCWVILSLIWFLEGTFLTEINPLSTNLVRIFLAAIPSFFVLYFLAEFLPRRIILIFLSGAAFLLIYIFSLLVSKSFDSEDFSILRSIFLKGRKILHG